MFKGKNPQANWPQFFEPAMRSVRPMCPTSICVYRILFVEHSEAAKNTIQALHDLYELGHPGTFLPVILDRCIYVPWHFNQLIQGGAPKLLLINPMNYR